MLRHWAIPILVAMIFSAIAAMRVGWNLGRRRLQRYGSSANEGLGAVDGAIFGLMGLLLAFTFTGAASRFEHRRELIVQEANDIGTAYLRLELLPEPARAEAKNVMKQYLDARLASYADKFNDEPQRRAVELQKQLWQVLVKAIEANPSLPLGQTVLPSINDSFDIATTRILATRQHPPIAIYLLLGLLVLVTSVLAGFGQAKAERQSILHLTGFALTAMVAFYMILDLEFPRLGFIQVSDFDKALIDLRASMD